MKKILVVVDMQADFVDGALGTKEATLIVPRVIEKIKGFDGEVVFTFDTHKSDYLTTAEGKKLPVEHCIKGTPGWELSGDIKALATGCRIFEKPTFGSIELAQYISQNGYDEIEIIGLCTDICVISNVLLIKAYLPESKITVDSSCCAGVTPDSHETALSAMKMCQIDVI